MDDDNKPTTIERIQNITPTKKDISRRVKKAERVTKRHARKFIVRRIENVRFAQRQIIMWLVAVAVLLSFTVVQLMWYRNVYQTTAPSASGTYAEGIVSDIQTLDPLYASTDAERALSQLIFSHLLTYDKSGKINYDLASSMTVSGDGLTYVFEIRKDALWHDGQKVTADDVVYTFKIIQDSSSLTTLSGWSSIKVSKVSDYAVKFVLPSRLAPFAAAIAEVPIVPKHILEKIPINGIRESDFSTNPIGSGPFKFSLFSVIDANNSRKAVLLESFKQYYKGTTRLDRFQLQTYANSSALYKGLTSGEVIAAAGLDNLDITKLSTNNYDIKAQPINSGVYALFNTSKEIFSDVNVRKALQLAISTTEIRKLFTYQPPALDTPVLSSLVGDGLPSADGQDLTRAAALLDGAGWKLDGKLRKKDGKALTISLVTIKGEYERVVDKLAEYWSKLGITVNSAVYDPSDVTQRFVQDVVQQRNYDILVYQLIIGGDADVYGYWHSSQTTATGYNFSNYSSGISDDALVSARDRLEPALRQKKYIQFSKQWLADVPAIGLYQSVMNYAHIKSATSFDSGNVTPYPENRYEDILYWSTENHSVYTTP